MNDCVQAKQLDGGALLGIPKAISLNLQNPNRFNSDVFVARDTSCCYPTRLFTCSQMQVAGGKV